MDNAPPPSMIREIVSTSVLLFSFYEQQHSRGPSYGVYISQLVRIGRICSTNDEFIKRNMMITTKLIKQGFRYKLVRSFKRFYVKYKHLMIQRRSEETCL